MPDTIHNKHLCALLLGLSIFATTGCDPKSADRPDAAVSARAPVIVLTNTTDELNKIGLTRGPVIVLMDTTAPRGIYDSDNITTGRGNADELYKVLDSLDGIVQQNVHREGIGLEWARDSHVAGLHPDIVIIHRSSFFHPLAAQLKLPDPPFADAEDGKKWQAIYHAQDARLRSFLRTVGAVERQTQFLIYARGTDTNWLNDEFRANWTKTLELELPTFKGRINTMVIPNQPNGANGTFRDPATMKELRSRVSEMIKKLEKRKAEKAK